MARDAEVRRLDRACLLVVAMAAAVFALVCIVDVVDVLVMRLPRVSLWLVLLIAPWLIALHFRWQAPARTSLATAAVTTVISLALACLLWMTFGLWLHFAIGGAL
jgi:hypothetical protein